MQCFVSEKNKQFWQAFFVAVFAVCIVVFGSHHSVNAVSGTTIGATVCADTSTITLTGPTDGGTITTSSVVVEGATTQASQVEIVIDGAFDSVLPLSIGQTTFSGTVQLSAGTHTIKATAVNLCGGSDASAEVTLTYEPIHSGGGDGGHEGTPGGVATEGGDSGVSGVASGVTVGAVENQTGSLDPLKWTAEKIGDLAEWLNINTADAQDTSTQVLSPWRAVALTAGVYLSVIGIAPVALGWLADITSTTLWSASTTKPRRIRVLSIAVRVIGIFVIAVAILL